MNMNTGVPAFPNITPDMPVDGHPGMTLRDYFAAKAMPKAFEEYGREPRHTGDRPPTARGCARKAYDIADAMLAEREPS